MTKVIDTQAYLDTVCDLLRAGHTHIPVVIAGTSMTPFLDPGDTVFLDLPTRPPEPGDIALFTRPGGRYVLHRIVHVHPDGTLDLLGDAQIHSERIAPAQIRAIVTGARRGTRYLDETSLRWRFFRGPWQKIHTPRPYINRIRTHILALSKKDEA